MILSNPHTHSDYVDGKSSAREQIEAALKLNFVSLGFSEHAYQGKLDPDCGLRLDNRGAYVNEIESLRREYESKIKIWLGMEIDIKSPESGADLDYFIGASHYFGQGGSYTAVDGNADELEAYVLREFNGRWDDAIAQYYLEYAEGIERLRPTIIAHFDLIRKNNLKRHWFSEDGALLSLGKQTMRRMIASCDLMEVNTGGMARSGQTSPYPTFELLKYWREIGGRVIISSDCHNSMYLNAYFDFALDYIKRAGFEEYVMLDTADRLLESRKIV